MKYSTICQEELSDIGHGMYQKRISEMRKECFRLRLMVKS